MARAVQLLCCLALDDLDAELVFDLVQLLDRILARLHVHGLHGNFGLVLRQIHVEVVARQVVRLLLDQHETELFELLGLGCRLSLSSIVGLLLAQRSKLGVLLCVCGGAFRLLQSLLLVEPSRVQRG